MREVEACNNQKGNRRELNYRQAGENVIGRQVVGNERGNAAAACAGKRHPERGRAGAARCAQTANATESKRKLKTCERNNLIKTKKRVGKRVCA